MDNWRGAIIDGLTQSGKTWKCIDILHKKLKEKEEDKNALILFVTQANSVASAEQILQRLSNNEDINIYIKKKNFHRSGDAPKNATNDNYLIVDFWNSRNMENMLEFCTNKFSQIIIVIDECEQGGYKGVKDRLCFIRKVEKVGKKAVVKVIFVTATVANLSKNILHIANENLRKFNTGVVNEIINNRVVEHYFAKQHKSYVPSSWFKDAKDTDGVDVWQKLVFPQKESNMTKEDYILKKERIIRSYLSKLKPNAKELSFIVTSTYINDHKRFAKKLYNIGYNVTVELNGINKKNYKVNYLDESGDIVEWEIPYNKIETQIENGDLESFRDSQRNIIKSGIYSKNDVTLSHVLQAALFMCTESENRIRQNISSYEFNKLDAISNAISNMSRNIRRPENYPISPKVALICGHLAGRGITIQNPFIDFTCTSFCFTGTSNSSQRGANNTQRFGRACGMLREAFARPGRLPVLIATDCILQDAIANEHVLCDKAKKIKDGTMISLKELISEDEWKKAQERAKKHKSVLNNNVDNVDRIDNVVVNDLVRYYKSEDMVIGKMIRYLYHINKPVSFEEFKSGMEYDKTDEKFTSNLSGGRSNGSHYGKLWTFTNKMISLNPNIKNYLDKMKK